MEKYEGDFGCSLGEDSRCPNVASQVYREPYTPAGFAVLVCDECAGHCIGFGYFYDAQATSELREDIQHEQQYFESEEYAKMITYDKYEAAQLQRLDEIMDGD